MDILLNNDYGKKKNVIFECIILLVYASMERTLRRETEIDEQLSVTCFVAREL